jgi:hypothetical protein
MEPGKCFTTLGRSASRPQYGFSIAQDLDEADLALLRVRRRLKHLHTDFAFESA